MLVLCAHTKYSMTDNLVFLEIFNMIKFEKIFLLYPVHTSILLEILFLLNCRVQKQNNKIINR